MPTNLHPESSDHRPALSVYLGGRGGGVFLPFPHRAPPSPLLFLSYLPPEWPPSPSPNPAQFPWFCPSEFLVTPPPCSFPSVPCGIPDLRHHWNSSSLTVPCRTCQSWCSVDLPPYYVPAQAHVSACRTLCNLPLRVNVGIYLYHPPPRGFGVLRTCRRHHLSKYLHDPQLRVYSVVENCVSSTSPAAQPCSNPMSVRFTASLLIFCWPIRPSWRQGQPLLSVHLFLKPPKLRKGFRLHVLYGGHVAGV